MAEKSPVEKAIEKALGGGGPNPVQKAIDDALGGAPKRRESKGRSLWGQVTDTLWAAPGGLVTFGNELQKSTTAPLRIGIDVARGRAPWRGGVEGFLTRYQPAPKHFAESMGHTGGRLGQGALSLAPGGLKPSETEYGRAIRESRIVPVLAEDIGNASIVAGGVGAGVGRAGRTVAGRAGVPAEVLRAEAAGGGAEAVARAGGPAAVAEARRAFRSDYVPPRVEPTPGTTVARDALDAADARALGQHDLAYDTGVRPGTAEAKARAAERGVIEVGAEGPAATRRVVNDADAIAARQKVEQMTGTAKGLFRVEYPVRQAARLGDRVSGDPSFLAQQIARPFKAGYRAGWGAGETVGPVQRLIAGTEKGAAALKGVRDWRIAHEARLEASEAFRGEVEKVTQPAVHAMERAVKVLPEPELQVASYMLVDQAVNPNILRVVDDMAAQSGLDKADVLREVFDGDEQMVAGYDVAEQYLNGTLDLKTRQRMDEAQAILRPVREQSQQRYLRGYGAKEGPTDAMLRRRAEQIGSEPMPSVVEEMVGPSERRYDAQAEVVAEARERADRAAGRRVLTPEQYRADATKQVADTYRQAREHARRIVTDNPDVAARALGVDEGRLLERVERNGETVLQPSPAMIDRLADSLIVGPRSRSAGVREAFDLAAERGFAPPDLSLRRAGTPALRAVETRAEAKGEAFSLAREADRLARLSGRDRPSEGILVMHGGPEDFAGPFDFSRAGSSGPNLDATLGAHFTTDEGLARRFAEGPNIANREAGGGAVMRRRLHVKKPAKFDSAGALDDAILGRAIESGAVTPERVIADTAKAWGPEASRNLAELLDPQHPLRDILGSPEQALREHARQLYGGNPRLLTDAERRTFAADFRRSLQASGFDSIRVGADHYIAFDPQQIRPEAPPAGESVFGPVERQAGEVARLRDREQQAAQRGEQAVEQASREAAQGAATPDDLFSARRPAPAPGTPEFRERIAEQEPPPEAVSGREAARRVRQVREETATKAAEAQGVILSEMDRLFEGGRLDWPDGDPRRIGGEWDFLDPLSLDEINRLREAWGGGVMGPDQLAQAAGMDTGTAMEAWLRLTREYDELGKLTRRGKVGKNTNVIMPLEKGRASLDPSLLWRLGDADLDTIQAAYDKNITEGALHLGRTSEAAQAEWEQRVAGIEAEVRAAQEPMPERLRAEAQARFDETWQRVSDGAGDDLDFMDILPRHEAEALTRAGVGGPDAPSWFEVVQRKVAGDRVVFGDEWVTDMAARRDAALAAGDDATAEWVQSQIEGLERTLPDVAADTAVGGLHREALEAIQAEEEMRAAGLGAPRAEDVVSPAARPLVAQMRAEQRTAAGVADLDARRARAAERIRAQGRRQGAQDARSSIFGDLSQRYGDRAVGLAEGHLPRYETRVQAAAELTGRPIEQARRTGEREQAARTAERTLSTEERRLARAQERMDTARREALASPQAAPARFAGPMTMGANLRRVGQSLIEAAEQSAPGSGVGLHLLLSEIDDSVARLAAAGVNPEHIIGGDQWGAKRGAGGGSEGLPLRRGKAGEQYEKSRTASQAKRTVVGQTQEMVRRERRHAVNEVSRQQQEHWGRTAADVLGPEAEGLRGEALVKAMADAPLAPGSTHRVKWVATNPGGLFDEVTPKQVGPDTLFVPEPVHKALFKSIKFDDPSLALRIYDRANNVYRIAWLPLSPRWLTGNVVGNALMGMSEVGPTAYFRALPEALRMVKDGTMPMRLGNRGFTRQQRDLLYSNMEVKPVGKVRAAARAGIEKSFAFNEFIDNVSRSSVYVAAKKGGASRSQAIKRALRAAGDFQKMTPFERNVVKRGWLFWPWYKHITKLTLSLPVNHPHRVMWTMFLGSVFGDPEDQRGLPGFLRGSIPVDAEDVPGFLRTEGEGEYRIGLGGLNPFQSGVNSPLFSVEGATRSLAPAIANPISLLLGKDPAKAFADIARPPGSKNLSEGGGETTTSLLGDPRAMAWYLASDFSQLRLLQNTDLGRKIMGAPAPDADVVRYPTGEPWFFAGGEAQPTGTSGAGEALSFFSGVPYPRRTDVEGMKERHAEAVGRRTKSRENYRRRVEDLERQR